MFITIRNLPYHIKTKDVKKLMIEKCSIEEVIFGELTREEQSETKKITIGLADECDAAIVFRILNGFHFNGYPLIVEDSRKKKGPAPGSLPQVPMTPAQLRAATLQMQSQQMMGIMSSPMMQQGVLNSQGYGMETLLKNNLMNQRQLLQPTTMMTNQVTVLQHNQPIVDQNLMRHNQQMMPHAQQLSQNIPMQYNQPTNQPMHQIIQPRPQMVQPRPQMVQSRPKMVQPRPKMVHPRPQIVRPQHQISQPHQHINQSVHQFASVQPPYEEPRSTQKQKPYMKKAIVHQKVLEWEIPSREVVVEETDPVWGVRVIKQSYVDPSGYEQDSALNEISTPVRSRWNETGNTNVMDNVNAHIPMEDPNYFIDTNYYHQQSTHNETYHSHNDGACYYNYANTIPVANEPFDTMAPPITNEPEWEPEENSNDNNYVKREPHENNYAEWETQENSNDNNYAEWETQDNSNYNNYAIKMRKRNYRQVNHEQHKRPKPHNYDNTYSYNEFEDRDNETAMCFDSSIRHDESGFGISMNRNISNNSEMEKDIHRAKRLLSDEKFNEFNDYISRNLISKSIITDREATKRFRRHKYYACKQIANNLTKSLNINLYEYRYFFLKFIEVKLEQALGDKITDECSWNPHSFVTAFKCYTFTDVFLEFQTCFNHYGQLHIIVPPSFALLTNQNKSQANPNYLKKQHLTKIPQGRPIAQNRPVEVQSCGEGSLYSDANSQGKEVAQDTAVLNEDEWEVFPTEQSESKNILSTEKYNEFKDYMSKNLKSLYIITDSETMIRFNKFMYDACKLIVRQISKALKVSFHKYSYFVLSFMRVIIERTIGCAIKNETLWNLDFVMPKLRRFTFIKLFFKFQFWFENYDKLDLPVMPWLALIMERNRSRLANYKGTLDSNPIALDKANLDETCEKMSADQKMAFDKACQKAETLLFLPLYNEEIQLQTKMKQQITPELWTALEMEMNDLFKVSQSTTVPDTMHMKFKLSIKRAIANRLMDTHIAVTALVTFYPAVPSGAACNEFFNGRHGRVLHSVRQMALVLFTNNHTFTLMCAEKDSLVDGCKIQNIVALDLNNYGKKLCSVLDHGIKEDNLDEIYDIVLNKSYFEVNLSETKEKTNQLGSKTIELNKKCHEIASNETQCDIDVKFNPESEETSQQTDENYSNEDNSKISAKQSINTNITSNSQTKKPPNDESENALDTNTDTMKDTQTQKSENINTEITTNTQTEQDSNMHTDKQTDQHANFEDDNSWSQSPLDEDRDERIKEFLDDFEKVINENEEVFMSEDDLEEFEL